MWRLGVTFVLKINRKYFCRLEKMPFSVSLEFILVVILFVIAMSFAVLPWFEAVEHRLLGWRLIACYTFFLFLVGYMLYCIPANMHIAGVLLLCCVGVFILITVGGLVAKDI